MVTKYKQTEIGAIPDDWDVMPFGDTFTFLSNNTLSRDQLNYDGGTIKDVHYGDVLILFPETLDCSRADIPYINHDVHVSCQPLQNGDIVIADTAEDETAGKATEIINKGKNQIVSGLHTIPCRVVKGQFAPGWLGYFINSHYYHDQLLPYIHGTKVSSIARESLKKTYVVIPPYEEQEKIVQSLSDMDALIAQSEQVVKKYQALKETCLQHMFPRKGQTEPDMRLPGFTGAWEQRKLGELADVTKLAGFEFTKYVTYSDTGNIIALRGMNIKNNNLILDNIKYIDGSDFSKLKRSKLFVNDILFTYVGTIGELVVIKENDKYYLAPNVARIRIKDNIDPEFIAQLMESDDFYNNMIFPLIATSSQPALSMENIRKFLLSLPKNTEEQIQISTVFKKLNNIITLHQRKCEKLKLIKQGMMEELLTGKVRLV